MNTCHTALRLAFAAMSAGVSIAQAQGPAKSVEQLEKELAGRDALITDLQRRVNALEQTGMPAHAKPSPGPAKSRPSTGLKLETPADAVTDEDNLARALERSLALSGGLLVPSGQFEIAPGLRYDSTRRSGLGIVGGAVASRDVRRDTYLASLSLKAGLPWDSQLELAMPYGQQRVESTTAGVSSKASTTGIGDVQIGASKQLVNEGARMPGLIGNVTWQHATGRSSLAALGNGTSGMPLPVTSLGAGYDSVATAVTAVKRTDPLVFVGSLSHAFNGSASVGGIGIEPADTNSASLRAILAASPTVSLRGGFSVGRTSNMKLNGVTVPASSQNVGLLELGTSIVLDRRTLFDFSVGAGLTQDSPDYVVGLSLPIRF